MTAISGPRGRVVAGNEGNGEDHGDRAFLSITVVKMSPSLARDSNAALRRLQSISLMKEWPGERSTLSRSLE